MFGCLLIKLHRDNLAARLPNLDKLMKYKDFLINFMRTLPNLAKITNEDCFKRLLDGSMTRSKLELFAILHMERISLKVTDHASKTSFEYTCPDSRRMIVLIHLNHYYIVTMLNENPTSNSQAPNFGHDDGYIRARAHAAANLRAAALTQP